MPAIHHLLHAFTSVALQLRKTPSTCECTPNTHTYSSPRRGAAFWRSWRLTLVMLAALPALAVCGVAFGTLAGKLSTRASDAYGAANSIAQQARRVSATPHPATQRLYSGAGKSAASWPSAVWFGRVDAGIPTSLGSYALRDVIRTLTPSPSLHCRRVPFLS